jgi:hypothetical protein
MLNSHMCSFPSSRHHFYPFFNAARCFAHEITLLGLALSKMGASGADSTEMGSAECHASILHHMSVDS